MAAPLPGPTGLARLPGRPQGGGGRSGLAHAAAMSTPPALADDLRPAPAHTGPFKPCPHLQAVLRSRAAETATATNALAIKVALSTHPAMVRHGEAPGQPQAAGKVRAMQQRVFRCHGCLARDWRALFLCLQCPYVGCHEAHARQHAKAQAHSFAIDLALALLFCFECGDYTHDAALAGDRLGAMLHAAGLEPPASPAASESWAQGYTKPAAGTAMGLKGLVNLGATCFMSSVLQTMLHNPLVRDRFFHNDDHFFACASLPVYLAGDKAITEDLACTTCLVDATFRAVYAGASTEGLAITTVLNTAWFRNRLLAGFSEQDAHEFWQFLLNEFHADCVRVSHANNGHSNGHSNGHASNGHSNGTANGTSKPCPCIMHSIFAGELESAVACSACEAVTKTVDPLVDLALEIPRLGAPSLLDCLDQFTHTERLDSAYKCRACNAETQAHKSLRMKRFPRVLSVQLKRFKHNFANDTASKIADNVDVPLFVDLLAYLADPADGSRLYELFAVVAHTGLVNTGHYVANVKGGTGQWFRFDDSVVSCIAPEDVSTNAYLLFYLARTG